MTVMKKIIYSLLLLSFTLLFSCKDESLDPFQLNKVKKGTILALRGTQLDNIYNNGLPGAEFFPEEMDGTEVFEFEAEYLAEDPQSLESFDIYVVKRTKVGNLITLSRIFLRNVPFSEFSDDGTYPNPWVSVSIDLVEILELLGLDYTNPDDLAIIKDTYEFGIAIESDLNLKDGSKVLAAEIVAPGLFQSDQFYPAQKLTYSVLKYCPEDIGGTYSYQTTVTAVGTGGSLAGCTGGVSGDGSLTFLSLGKYAISDVTFGQYGCAWDDAPATGATLVNSCDQLTFGGADQYGLVYTILNVSVSADGTKLSFKWENDYGDKGNTVLTRTDDKLWPLTLFSAD
jgi:hypothetical protein